MTIFASHQSLRAGLRSSINQILADIIELHEDILGELHRAVPHSEYTQIEYDLCRRTTTKRRQSLSAAPRRRKGAGGTSKPLMHLHHLRDIPGMIAEPQVAAEVAKIFNRKVCCYIKNILSGTLMPQPDVTVLHIRRVRCKLRNPHERYRFFQGKSPRMVKVSEGPRDIRIYYWRDKEFYRNL